MRKEKWSQDETKGASKNRATPMSGKAETEKTKYNQRTQERTEPKERRGRLTARTTKT